MSRQTEALERIIKISKDPEVIAVAREALVRRPQLSELPCAFCGGPKPTNPDFGYGAYNNRLPYRQSKFCSMECRDKAFNQRRTPYRVDLKARERRKIMLDLRDQGLSFKELGKQFDLSPGRIRQLVEKAKRERGSNDV